MGSGAAKGKELLPKLKLPQMAGPSNWNMIQAACKNHYLDGKIENGSQI